MRDVAGVMLAAGTSSRLGTNKLLLEVEGEAMVRRVARRALEGGLSPLLVVVGFEAALVSAALHGLPVETAVNPDFAAGMHLSLRSGLARVPETCAAACVLLADMPLVTSAMLRQMLARFRVGGDPLVVSLYGDVPAPPTLYPRRLFAALAAAGAGGGRQVVGQHRAEAIEMRWPRERLADVDWSEDVATLRTLVGGGGRVT